MIKKRIKISYKKEKFTEDNNVKIIDWLKQKTPKKNKTDKKNRNERNYHESREDESVNIDL